jgi:hypothetical protein
MVCSLQRDTHAQRVSTDEFLTAPENCQDFDAIAAWTNHRDHGEAAVEGQLLALESEQLRRRLRHQAEHEGTTEPALQSALLKVDGGFDFDPAGSEQHSCLQMFLLSGSSNSLVRQLSEVTGGLTDERLQVSALDAHESLAWAQANYR